MTYGNYPCQRWPQGKTQKHAYLLLLVEPAFVQHSQIPSVTRVDPRVCPDFVPEPSDIELYAGLESHLVQTSHDILVNDVELCAADTNTLDVKPGLFIAHRVLHVVQELRLCERAMQCAGNSTYFYRAADIS